MKTTRPTVYQLRPELVCLEDRAVPAFGFGSAFAIGSATTDPTASLDVGIDIAMDPTGSVYVTGYYSSTVNFDPNGTNPTSHQVLTSVGVNDGYVAKYLADGTFEWATDLGAAGWESISVQGANVYIGYSKGFGPSDTFVSQLNAADGTLAWTTALSTNNPDRSVDVAAGPSGSVYVTGNNSSAQAVVAKLDVAGNVLWSQTSSGGTSLGRGIAVDGSGNVFATGDFTGAVTFGSTTLSSQAGSKDAFIWKLNPSGGTVWAGGVGGIGNDSGYDIAADAVGSCVLTGQWGTAANISMNNNFNPGSGVAKLTYNGGSTDIFIVKLSPATGGAMTLAWAKDIGGAGQDMGRSVTLDMAGNVYSTGSYTGPVDFDPGPKKYVMPGFGINPTTHQVPRAIFVSKLDASGNFVAAAAMGGLEYDDGTGIALDGGGNVWTTGGFRGVCNFDPTGGTYNLTQSGYPGIVAYDAFVSKLSQVSPNVASRIMPPEAMASITPATAPIQVRRANRSGEPHQVSNPLLPANSLSRDDFDFAPVIVNPVTFIGRHTRQR
jgi:hypothetical protein